MFLKKPKYELCKRARIFLGTKCSSVCPFCYYRNDEKYFHSPSTIRSYIDNVYRLGFVSVDFTGGEPLEYPYLQDLLKISKSYNLETGLVTQYFDVDKLLLIKDVLDDIVVSYHTVIYNKRFMRQHVEDFLHAVYSLFPFVRINITLHSQINLENLFWLLDLIKQLDKKKIQVNIHPFNYWANTQHKVDRHKLLYNLWYQVLHKLLDMNHVEVNVKYVPFCILRDHLHVVNGLYQHLYDIRDWYPDYDCVTYKEIYPNLEDYAINYIHFNKFAYRFYTQACYKCQLLPICEGIQKGTKDLFFVKPINTLGSYVYDPMHFRYNKNYTITHKVRYDE